MTITLPLGANEEAKLMALAKEKGVSADELVREAVDRLLSSAGENGEAKKEPTRSAYGILAKYGPAPSAEEIDQNRAEMFANFGS